MTTTDDVAAVTSVLNELVAAWGRHDAEAYGQLFTADATYTTSTTTLSANWTASASSDVAGYEYAIGTSAGGTQVLGFTDVGNVTSVTRTALSLTSGTMYFISVRTYDVAGNRSAAISSNGILVDNLAPTSSVTSPANGTSLNSLSSFTGSASDADSGLQKVEVSIKRNSDNKYWDGSGFNSSTEVFDLASGTTSWSYAFSTPADGSYIARSRATDNATIVVIRAT